MADLFELSALANKLQATLDTGSALEARRIASAWLGSATQLSAWPTPVPEDLRAWGIELASLIYDNPSWLEMEQDGDHVSRWALGRVTEILAAAKAAYVTGAAAGQPVGSFPDPEPYPDPATASRYSFPVSWRLTP